MRLYPLAQISLLLASTGSDVPPLLGDAYVSATGSNKATAAQKERHMGRGKMAVLVPSQLEKIDFGTIKKSKTWIPRTWPWMDTTVWSFVTPPASASLNLGLQSRV